MTTIAYCDGVLAGDTLFTDDNHRDSYGAKVFRLGEVLVAFAGSLALGLRFRDWVRRGLEGPSPYVGVGGGNGLIVSRAGVLGFCAHGSWPVEEPFYALGTGAPYSLGAMSMGADAREAVTVAMRFDTQSGGDIVAYRLGAG